MPLKFVSRPQNAGFSLVEIAIVIVIAGILLSLFTGSLMTLVTNSKLKTTQTRLKEINEALRTYAANNNRFPCVASWKEVVNSADYGKEIATNCPTAASGAESAGNVRVAGRGGRQIRIGMVPTRSLNLPDEYGYDAWGGRYVYAVTEALTRTDDYNLNEGAISIVGIDGSTSLLNANGVGTYLVLSLGEDKEGAYNTNGVEMATWTSGRDRENCDWDDVFMDTYYQSDAGGVNQFDDHVVYSANFQTSLIPSGAVMAFNLSTCPPGWSALPATVGRFVMGAGDGYSEGAPPNSDINFSSRNYALGQDGGWITRYNGSFTPATGQRYDNSPPYVAYRYCEKK